MEPNPFEKVEAELAERHLQQTAVGDYILDGGDTDPPAELARFILEKPDILSRAIDARGITHDLEHATRIGKLIRGARGLRSQLYPPAESESHEKVQPKSEPRYYRA